MRKVLIIEMTYVFDVFRTPLCPISQNNVVARGGHFGSGLSSHQRRVRIWRRQASHDIQHPQTTLIQKSGKRGDMINFYIPSVLDNICWWKLARNVKYAMRIRKAYFTWLSRAVRSWRCLSRCTDVLWDEHIKSLFIQISVQSFHLDFPIHIRESCILLLPLVLWNL